MTGSPSDGTRSPTMDSISYYFKAAEPKKDSATQYLLHAFYVMHNKFWKGRRKDKDSPTPPAGEEQKTYLEDPNTKDRISDCDFFKLVALPPSLDLNEWLATHTISFFNHVNLIYGVVSQYCDTQSCPSMSAPDNVQYFWVDDKGKKNKNTASQYIDYVMTHIQKVVNDEAIFPTKFGHPFHSDLESIVKRIHKYLFHVLAHIYHAHYPLLHQLGLHAHLNTLFTHFMVFSSKFDLIQEKEAEILLKLFSLLLKNLADPSQNPQLRQELEEKAAAAEEERKRLCSEPMETANTDDPTQDDSRSSCPAVQPNQGAGDCDPAFHRNNAIDAKDSHLRKDGQNGDCKVIEQNGLHHQHSSSVISPHSPTSSTSPSSSLIPSSDLRMDSDPGKPPTDWLGGMQISAT